MNLHWSEATLHGRHFDVVFFLELLTFDKHDGPNIIMSTLTDVVDSGDDEHSAKHGGRPVPTYEGQRCVLTEGQAMHTWTRW